MGPWWRPPTPFVPAGPDKLPREPCLESCCSVSPLRPCCPQGGSLQLSFLSASSTPFALPAVRRPFLRLFSSLLCPTLSLFLPIPLWGVCVIP